MDKIGTFLEIIGLFIASTSLLGEERIQRLEILIKQLLDPKHTLPLIQTLIQKVSTITFQILLYPLTFLLSIASILIVVLLFLLDGSSNSAEFWLWILGYGERPVPFFDVNLWGLLLVILILLAFFTFILGFSIFEGVIAVIVYIIGIHLIFAIKIAEFLENFFSKILPYLVYSFIALVFGSLYILIQILLAPYTFSDKISERYNLRPTLGVVGFIVTLVGLMFQML